MSTVKQYDTADRKEPVTEVASPPPSSVMVRGCLLEAYGQPKRTIVLSWYGPMRRGMRVTLTTEQLRAYIAALETECARSEKTEVQP